MTYQGEHLLPGQIGHFSVVLSLVVSLMAAIAFFKASQQTLEEEKKHWLKLARTFFFIDTIAVITTIGCIYYILSHHLFEYYYAWNHSDNTLQPQYIFSCLWEGQEGSFLLWTFWQCVLGCMIILKGYRKWEAPVMAVISFSQFVLASMIIGLYFGSSLKIGSNPFLLMRDSGVLDGAPMFLDPATGHFRADYMQFLTNGSGLNASLQNYWMVIHPPVLFLGFASTVVPFAFAVAGLWIKDHSWTKLANTWANFSGAVLGLGIMMGAAWAYESLNFGGYWAWDPVENASLVPWLMMVAGLHTLLIYNHTKYSLKSTYVYFILSFSLVLYSTYLTRSGVLGDTSVHAFTGAGMDIQLIVMILIFLLPALTLYFVRQREIPTIKKEEKTWSREFWMFIGSLVLCLASLIIVGKTSMPIINKIFKTNLAQPEDVKYSYNQIMVFIAILIGLLTAIGQYLKYKDTDLKYFWNKIGVSTIIALALATLFSIFEGIHYSEKGIGYQIALYVDLYCAVYGVVANFGYIWNGINGKLKLAGGSIAHVGFTLLLLGIVLSSANMKLLSHNTTGIDLFQKSKDADPNENITLFKGLQVDMGAYDVTYISDSLHAKDNKRYFQIDFVDKKNKNEKFSAYPDVIKNNKGNEGFSANPTSVHYWNRDIFLYTSYWLPAKTDTSSFRPTELKVGDTTYYSNGYLILNGVDVNKNIPGIQRKPSELLMTLDMTVFSKDGERFPVNPSVLVSSNAAQSIPDSVSSQGLVIQFDKVLDDKAGKLQIGIKESNTLRDAITLKVLEFPFINIVWFGVIIMFVGFLMSCIHRMNEKKLRQA